MTLQKQTVVDYTNVEETPTDGYLSFDLGYKHMTAAYTTNFENFDIFLFDIDSSNNFSDRLKQIKIHINRIIELIGQQNRKHNTTPKDEKNIENDFELGKNNIKRVIMEEQVQTNIQALNIMYAMGMYFESNDMIYSIQPARLKYKIFNERDSRQFKNLSAQYVGGKLDKINVKYQNYKPKPFQNHRWMQDDLRQWLQQNKIDKADDIGDVILILKYFNDRFLQNKLKE